MNYNNHSSHTKTVIGVLLILIGGLFLLQSFEIIPFEISRIVFSWRFFILVIGIIILINSDNKWLGIVLTAIGTVLILPRIFPDIDIDGKLVAGIIIIALGIEVIFRSSRSNHQTKWFKTSDAIKKDYIDDVAVFGGGEKVLTSDNFKGGNITAIFGGSEIDLTGCKLAEGDNILNVTAIFGGTTIIVPRDWNVLLNVTPVFGGFSNKIKREPNLVVDQSRTLVIKGIAIFGGGEVKSIV